MGKQLSSLTGPLSKEATQLLIHTLTNAIATAIAQVNSKTIKADTDAVTLTPSVLAALEPLEEVALNGLLEKMVLRTLSHLSFDNTGQLRTVIPAVSGNLTTVTNVTNSGLGSIGLNNTSILMSNQIYYNSFRRNIT